MRQTLLLSAALAVIAGALSAATLGTVTTIVGEPSDLALDEARGRLYIVNSSQSRIEIYSIAQKTLLTPITVDPLPISAAMSRNGRYLYVTAYSAGTLDVIDLSAGTIAMRVSLPAAPEGVAVGADERVLITSAGTGTTASPQNTLLLYDPSSGSVTGIPVTLPGPTTPTSGQAVSRSRLIATPDGSYIIGLNNPSTTTRQIFVYETASASVLRSRTVTNISSVLSVSPDGSRFLAGLSMFETATLNVIAQQNAANSTYAFPTNANFNTQSNQGGSVFAPDGSVLYTAFNFAPVNSTQSNISQVMLNDPDNLLIKLAIQLPQNLIGRMVIASNGANIYALSESGFMVLPVSTIYDNPIAVPQSSVVLLTHDQCGHDESGKGPVHRHGASGHRGHYGYAGPGYHHGHRRFYRTGRRFSRRRFPHPGAGWRQRRHHHDSRGRHHHHPRHREPRAEYDDRDCHGNRAHPEHQTDR